MYVRSPKRSPAIARLPVFASFAGYRPAFIGADVLAGLTLAAIAVPEQMATARLAGLPPQAGFIAFLAGAIGFAIFGASRPLSVGADSTIAPIFAGSLASLSVAGGGTLGAEAAVLAAMVGALVLLAGVFRLRFVGELLSVPALTGFLAGIAIHILASQAPAAMGLAPPPGEVLQRLWTLAGDVPRADPWTLGLALGVAGLIALGERLDRRLPSALIAVAAATAVASLGPPGAHEVPRLGALRGGIPVPALPAIDPATIVSLAPLAALIALVVLIQTAAVSRAFPTGEDEPDADGDFIGVGAANLLASLAGAFPLNASPPRSAIAAETGARSQGASLTAAAILAALLVFGARLLAPVPTAALAGVLLFVAVRLVRVADMVRIARQSPVEALLVAATAVAVAALPVQWGVALGISLSVLHGVFSSTRVRLTPMARTPGTTIWWPKGPQSAAHGEDEVGVAVVAFPAPLTFLNADGFARQMRALTQPASGAPPRLVVLEASGVTMIDYTAAGAVQRAVHACRARGGDFALARLESTAAREQLDRLGLTAVIGADHIFESVQQALDALPRQATAPPSTNGPAISPER